ncbi:6895_t:CDS:1 [Cetraspora pellucida]|uniref:6895_t:CDS:1 n=1 Tax=Cetraspora pellucida TaxID=1433469 RepID=A0A9N8VJV0_9GLOM|nr:6895_t:CDS:1 [Cetraspora pellucida]
MSLSKEVILMILERYDYTSFNDVKSLYFVNKMFNEFIKSILLNIFAEKINNKTQLQINNFIKDCEVDEFNRYYIIFKKWIIRKKLEQNLNNYYKNSIHIVLKILVPKPVFNFMTRTYIYYFNYSNQFIRNLNTNVSYMIENNLNFKSNLVEIRDELYKYGTLDTGIVLILTEECFKINSDNLIEFTSSE